jgi:quercetin dioxygenase-like cupin family protein
MVSRLLPDPIPGMEIDRMELKSQARLKGTPHRAGTKEYFACESGEITLWVAGEKYELKVGDVAAFPGDQPHSYHNNGVRTAVGFSVVSIMGGINP